MGTTTKGILTPRDIDEKGRYYFVRKAIDAGDVVRLKNGVYDLELTLRDKNTDDPAATVSEKLVLNYDNIHPTLSSIQLMSSATPTTTENIFSRGGYDMEPYVSDFVPEQVERLNFYYEIYNINQELGKKPFLVVAYVEQQETGKDKNTRNNPQ